MNVCWDAIMEQEEAALILGLTQSLALLPLPLSFLHFLSKMRGMD